MLLIVQKYITLRILEQEKKAKQQLNRGSTWRETRLLNPGLREDRKVIKAVAQRQCHFLNS